MNFISGNLYSVERQISFEKTSSLAECFLHIYHLTKVKAVHNKNFKFEIKDFVVWDPSTPITAMYMEHCSVLIDRETFVCMDADIFLYKRNFILFDFQVIAQDEKRLPIPFPDIKNEYFPKFFKELS